MTLADYKKKQKRLTFELGGGVLMLALLLIDLVSKAVVVDLYNIDQSGYFLGIVKLTATRNAGIAFGIAADNPTLMLIITVLTVFMILAIGALYFTVFKENKPVRVTLAIIEAGALGNLIDRLCLGTVRDWIDVSRLGFGVCNLADFYITFSAVALFIIVLFIGKNAVFPLKKEWREQAAAEEKAAKEAPKTNGKS